MARTAIRVRDLHKKYNGLHVLRGVSLEAADGEVISIIGSSGSGKSTLLRCIPMLTLPDSGEIAIGDETIQVRQDSRGKAVQPERRQLSRLRSRLGFVFQDFNLWPHMTILQNVIEAPVHIQGRSRQDAIAEAEHLLEKVGIAEKRGFYPEQLSGGQQQRAAIARALAMQPQAMLFDEPTSALDPETVGEVLQVVRALAEEGRTMLIVTHEMRFAREVSTRVIFLHEGAVEEEGPPEQVFESPVSLRCRRFVKSHLAANNQANGR